VSSDKVSDWIKVQIEDLGYGFDIAEKVGQALSGFTRQVLMRMSRDDLFSELGSTTIDGNMKRALARGLNLCIQAAPQPQPLQPVSWQRSYVFCCICLTHSKAGKGQK